MAAIQPVDSIIKTLREPDMVRQIQRALPRHCTPERMLRIAETTLRRTPKVAQCQPLSVIGAIVEASQLGLEPDGVIGQAYLVPYKDQCQLVIGYKGLMDLARRSGQVLTIMAEIVHEADEFAYEFGLDPKLRHVPTHGRRGKMVAVYAVARLRDGGFHFVVLLPEDIEKIKASSAAKASGPWITHPEEMWKKSAIRRLCKYLPLSVELQRAVALDERAEAGLPQMLDAAFTARNGDSDSGAADMAARTEDVRKRMKRVRKSAQEPEPDDDPEGADPPDYLPDE